MTSAGDIRQALEGFLDRANFLNGLLHHLDAQLRWFRDSVRSSHADKISHLAAGSSLVVRDLTEWPEHGWPVFYSSGVFGTEGEEFLNLVDVLMAREAAWVVAQGFEALETCVKDLLAAHLLVSQTAADVSRVQKTSQRLLKAGMSQGQPEFWSSFVRLNYRSADKVLDEIRRIAPQLDEAEVRNNRTRPLVTWLGAVAEARHAVVHTNHTIARIRWTEIAENCRAVLEQELGAQHESDGVLIRPTVRQATEALVGLVEYGYAAFKALSLAQGTDWMVLREQGNNSQGGVSSSS